MRYKLTRKDYIKIARIIKDNTIPQVQRKDTLDKDNLIDDLSIVFKNDNTLFDKQRFIEACE